MLRFGVAALALAGCDVVLGIDHFADPHAVAFVQSTSDQVAHDTSLTVSLAHPSSGDLIVVAAGTFGSTLTNVTDSLDDAYLATMVDPAMGGTTATALWVFYTRTTAATDSLAITAHAGIASEISLVAHEYRVATMPDQVSTAHDTGTAVDSGPVTTLLGPEVYFAVVVHDETSAITPGPGFTLRETAGDNNATFAPIASEDAIAAAQTASAKFVLGTPSQWTCALLTFQ